MTRFFDQNNWLEGGAIDQNGEYCETNRFLGGSQELYFWHILFLMLIRNVNDDVKQVVGYIGLEPRRR